MRKRYVSFSLAGGRYCIPVDQVLQILRLEDLIQIPKPPPYVEGVINLRGDIIPVVSLRARLEITGGEAAAPGAQDQRKRRVVITRVGGKPYGLDVDEVRQRIVVFSVLDNLGKGGAQCGVENMNLMLGLPETTGLGMAGMYP